MHIQRLSIWSLAILFIVAACAPNNSTTDQEQVLPFVFTDIPEDVRVVDLNETLNYSAVSQEPEDSEYGSEMADTDEATAPVLPEVAADTGLVALRSARIRRKARIDADLAVLGHCGETETDPCPGDERELVVGREVTADAENTFRAKRILVKPRANLPGTVFGDEVKVSKRAEVGTVNEPLDRVPVLPAFLIGTPGTEDVQQGTEILAPGNYRDLRMKRDTSIQLSGGYYHFREIHTRKKTRIECLSFCIVLVKERLRIGRQSALVSMSGIPHEFYFFVEGRDNEEHPRHKAVRIGRNATVVADLFAPNGTFALRRESFARGIFIARDLRIGRGSNVTSRENLVIGGAEEVTAINLEVERVRFLSVDGETIEITPAVANADLLALVSQGQMPQLMGEALLPAGVYAGIELDLGAHNTVSANGQVYPLTIATGNRIKLNGDFTSEGGRISGIDLAFDPDHTLARPLDQTYYLEPAVSITAVNFEKFDGLEVIGPSGGTVETESGDIALDFPPGVIGEDTVIAIREIPPEESEPVQTDAQFFSRMQRVGGSFELTSNGAHTFSEPVTITARYSAEDGDAVGLQAQASIDLHLWNEERQAWEKLGAELDLPNRSLTYETTHFSSYALISNSNAIVIGPDDRELVQGSELTPGAPFSQIRHIARLSGAVSCTGFMISRNMLMTNSHCLPAICPSGVALFNQVQNPTPSGPSVFTCNSVVSDLPHLDAAIVRLNQSGGQSAGDVWGWFDLANSVPGDFTRTYTAGFPTDTSSTSVPYIPGSPFNASRMAIDRGPGCSVFFNLIQAILTAWGLNNGLDMSHNCDMNVGASGSPIVDYHSRNVVWAINKAYYNFVFLPIGGNLGTYMKSIVDTQPDANGNGVMDIIELDNTGNISLGFNTCVPVCFPARWFEGFHVQFQATGGVPPYSWTYAGLLPPNTFFTPQGVLGGGPTFWFGNCWTFAVGVTDSLGQHTARNATVCTGL